MPTPSSCCSATSALTASVGGRPAPLPPCCGHPADWRYRLRPFFNCYVSGE
ncbi:MAG TPA: hypothetical protein VLT83_17265 [Opitutaceae bacterium]|nr:hypothetical protein [Opitutaceae bacterium]